MASVGLDLPDPLEALPQAGRPHNADDLLAQMAGEEIDRLLAESMVSREPAADAVTPIEAPPATGFIRSGVVEPASGDFGDSAAQSSAAVERRRSSDRASRSASSPLIDLNQIADEATDLPPALIPPRSREDGPPRGPLPTVAHVARGDGAVSIDETVAAPAAQPFVEEVPLPRLTEPGPRSSHP